METQGVTDDHKMYKSIQNFSNFMLYDFLLIRITLLIMYYLYSLVTYLMAIECRTYSFPDVVEPARKVTKLITM